MHRCTKCGDEWETNYCPVCGCTIDRTEILESQSHISQSSNGEATSTAPLNGVTLPVVNGQLDLGETLNTCLGCGEKASSSVKVYLEDVPRPGLRGRISSFSNRIEGELPLCSHCIKQKTRLRLLIAKWVLLFFTCALASIAASVAMNVEVFIPLIAVCASVVPIMKVMQYWMAKDRFPILSYERLDSDRVHIELAIERNLKQQQERSQPEN